MNLQIARRPIPAQPGRAASDSVLKVWGLGRCGFPFFGIPWLLLVCLVVTGTPVDQFHFVIFGDRTGSTVPGVYEQVWRETAAESPAFVVSVGDTIEGTQDATAEGEWREVDRIHRMYRRYPLYLTPGNHDIWSAASERLFRQYAGRPPHYGFDYAQAHFTILDNSRSDELPEEELTFLEQDLKEHAAQPVKFVLMHRPSWLIHVALKNPNFPLHMLAKRYGVRYVIAGHVHQMMHAGLEGVTYISMPSSGGHLRNSGQYEDGWFFGRAAVDVRGEQASIHIEELKPPHGQGRISRPADWSLLGLVQKRASVQRAAGGSWFAGMPARKR